jgi:hypothetical protein
LFNWSYAQRPFWDVHSEARRLPAGDYKCRHLAFTQRLFSDKSSFFAGCELSGGFREKNYLRRLDGIFCRHACAFLIEPEKIVQLVEIKHGKLPQEAFFSGLLEFVPPSKDVAVSGANGFIYDLLFLGVRVPNGGSSGRLSRCSTRCLSG